VRRRESGEQAEQKGPKEAQELLEVQSEAKGSCFTLCLFMESD
jgi:hypothetical protein